MAQAAGRLGIGIIGAGKVGPILGAALAGAGHAIVGIAASSERNLERASAILPEVPVLDIPTLVERSELVILAIPEGEIESFAQGLADAGVWQPGQLVLHTAPGLGYQALAPALASGAIPLAVHPAMVFTGTSLDLTRLHETYCAVSAPTPVLPIAQALVVEMGAEPIVIAESERAAWAEAVSTATSFSAAIVGQSLDLLASVGVDAPSRVLGPLLRSSVESALARATATSIDVSLLDPEPRPHSQEDPS
ncbi:putative short-subunit dehydrogenase-like oxidoreductase (DUF2520 family) [Salinibacterium amurskyense]|uniref:Putative short-subunit dehydrogenase-like oxidoreductase (DUF2520 family) n=1 Tax=Salinibacterium amurskyense TaxID=205941 RepID=A0A2M9D7D3_9MICO|nr:Rossmann-like and DUF2520 domain-containing protein [Salinibacterium amurskyense]PJJ81403.1 putative short-subunit dehydrogenase-like oxidoreductase (DUF2520 family) [Salinibacterium amurskyense]RLQ83403.1 DUF2520 domain-containing protein [Salinibacterium amurskyense]GHD80609.1 hypothetical protein GCM10007394_12330 [Salinibacterium amurskyense]